MLMNDSKTEPIRRYGIAVLSVALATLAGLLLEPELQRHLPFVWFFGALTFTAWYAGFRPAIAATVLSGALAAYLFLPPDYSLKVDELVDQLALIVFLAIGMAIALYSRRVAFLREIVRERLHDGRIARQIQQGLLPKEMPAVAGFRIAGRSLPARDVGGDCFDFLPLTSKWEDCLGIVVADASGHGMGSALVIAEARAYLRALTLTCADVGRILTLTNRRLAEELPSDCFVTLFLARLDPRAHAMVYANAGHCPGYVLQADGSIKTVLHSSALPLGIDRTCEYPTSPPVTLCSGDLILLFTDGLVEACSPRGQPFGSKRLLDFVRTHRQKSPDAILTSLLQAVSSFTQKATQLDDVTAVVIRSVLEDEHQVRKEQQQMYGSQKDVRPRAGECQDAHRQRQHQQDHIDSVQTENDSLTHYEPNGQRCGNGQADTREDRTEQ
jgi:serine phosphatase RsbU (regulator of sigma subunit)